MQYIVYMIKREERLMNKTATWMTKTGKQVDVSVELITSKTVNADGVNVDVACCEIEIIATVAGMGIVGTGAPRTMRPTADGPVACIGKLGLTTETLEMVNSAIAEVKTAPEWLAKIAAEEAAEEESKRYDAHCATMRRAMGY
jgi:hypothetical protein